MEKFFLFIQDKGMYSQHPLLQNTFLQIRHYFRQQLPVLHVCFLLKSTSQLPHTTQYCSITEAASCFFNSLTWLTSVYTGFLVSHNSYMVDGICMEQLMFLDVYHFVHIYLHSY